MLQQFGNGVWRSLSHSRSSRSVRIHKDDICPMVTLSCIQSSLTREGGFVSFMWNQHVHGAGRGNRWRHGRQCPKTSKPPSCPTRHYLTPHVSIVESSQHIWTQNFITSLFQKHLGTRFIFSLSMQRAVKHKRDLWRQKRTWLYIPITSEWRDVGRHTLCTHTDVWVKEDTKYVIVPHRVTVALAMNHPAVLGKGEWARLTYVTTKMVYREKDIIQIEKYSKEFPLVSFHSLFASLAFATHFAIYRFSGRINGGKTQLFFFPFTTAPVSTQSMDWHTQIAHRLFGWLDRYLETGQPNIIGRTYDILAADGTTPHEKNSSAWAMG